jgi:uncharacterized protein YbjQ (UPF0145 family)
VGFFRRAEEPDEAGGPSDALSRIEAGGIPLAAEQRLKALGSDGSLFTSGLSVDEFALLGHVGPRPLAQVLGASVMHVGGQYLPALPPYVKRFASPYEYPYDEPSFGQRRAYQWHDTVVCELDTISHAWSEVRRLALNRLSEEALQVGADAVVGVHLTRGEHDWAKGTIDYLLSGTAIRAPGSTQQSWPLLSDLSVQEYWRLHGAGYAPAGLIAATAAVFVSASRSTRLQRARSIRANQELEELSHGFQLARESSRWSGCRPRPRRSPPRGSSGSSSTRRATAGAAT